MSTQTSSRTYEYAELKVAVHGAIEQMRSTLSQLAVVVSHENPSRPEMQVLEDVMKVLVMQAGKLASTYLGEPVRSFDELPAKYRQHDDKPLQRIKAQYVMRQVRNTLVVQMQDEVKELRRRLATFEEGGKSLVELEKADRELLTAQVRRMEEQIAAHKDYTALVHRDLAYNASEFRRFSSRLEHVLSTLKDNFKGLEECTKDWAVYRNYEIFLKACQHIFDKAIASMGCAPTAGIQRSPALQKAVCDGMNMAAVSLLLHLHGRITGSDVCGPEIEVLDVEACIGDLQHKILLHHDEAKLEADNLRLSLINTKKHNDLLKENLQTCQKHMKELQEMIDDREKRGNLGEVPSDNSH